MKLKQESILSTSLLELAEEFEETAKQLEILAFQYKKRDMPAQYEIMWHEGSVYRYCALRLREEAE